MALRSLVTKLPGLVPLRSPTVHALSPAAAGSRLMSRLRPTNLPSAQEGRKAYSQEEINRMRAEIDETMKEINRDIAALGENTCSPDAAQFMETFRKELEDIRKTCYVFLLLCVPATILISRI